MLLRSSAIESHHSGVGMVSAGAKRRIFFGFYFARSAKKWFVWHWNTIKPLADGSCLRFRHDCSQCKIVTHMTLQNLWISIDRRRSSDFQLISKHLRSWSQTLWFSIDCRTMDWIWELVIFNWPELNFNWSQYYMIFNWPQKLGQHQDLWFSIDRFKMKGCTLRLSKFLGSAVNWKSQSLRLNPFRHLCGQLKITRSEIESWDRILGSAVNRKSQGLRTNPWFCGQLKIAKSEIESGQLKITRSEIESLVLRSIENHKV